MTSFLLHILTTLLLAILKVVCLLIAIAYFTLAERKIMAAVQRRVGPNVVGPFGLLQPLADGLKLAGKELAIPAQASSRIFLSVAITVLLFALSGWSAIPFGMFDHSEHMDTSSVAKILVLTEPRIMTLQERWRLIDESGVTDKPRGSFYHLLFNWQVTVKFFLEEFKAQFVAVDYTLTAEEIIMQEKIEEGLDYWEHYLDTHGHSPEAVAYVDNIRGQFAVVRELLDANEAAVEKLWSKK
jgi:hypothetical protein